MSNLNSNIVKFLSDKAVSPKTAAERSGFRIELITARSAGHADPALMPGCAQLLLTIWTAEVLIVLMTDKEVLGIIEKLLEKALNAAQDDLIAAKFSGSLVHIR